MAYARSKKSVTRIEPLLDQLLTSSDDVIFRCDEPQKVAYQLHEALKSAGFFPEYQKYLVIRDKFTIRTRAGKVIAELKTRPIIDSIKGMKVPPPKVTIDAVLNPLEIVGATIANNKPEEIYFPVSKLSEAELSELYIWASFVNYFIINHGDNGVTLTKDKPQFPLAAWEPKNG